MHFANAKLNPRFGMVGWNSAPQPGNGMGHRHAKAALRVGGYGDGNIVSHWRAL
jgi:hypothetical protein